MSGSELVTIATSRPATLAEQTYSRIADPLAFAAQLGDAAASMMGAPVNQGQAIALAALCEGITLIEMRRRYHWIQGRPVKQAAAMLAEFRMNYGGDFAVLSRSADECSIQFTDSRGRSFNRSITWEQMQESRWPWKNWKDHSEGLKDNWATPTDRESMMFARLVSDSLRFICPELVAGVYTPEEMLDVTAMETSPAAKNMTASEMLAQQAKGGKEQESEIDAEFTIIEEPAAPAAPANPVASQDALISPGQVQQIFALFADLRLDEAAKKKVLANRGVASVDLLTSLQAKVLIERMQQQLAASKKTDPSAGNAG